MIVGVVTVVGVDVLADVNVDVLKAVMTVLELILPAL